MLMSDDLPLVAQDLPAPVPRTGEVGAQRPYDKTARMRKYSYAQMQRCRNAKRNITEVQKLKNARKRARKCNNCNAALKLHAAL